MTRKPRPSRGFLLSGPFHREPLILEERGSHPHCATRIIVYSLIRAHGLQLLRSMMQLPSRYGASPCMIHGQRYRTKMNRPELIVDLSEAHRLSDQGFAQEEHLSDPFDLPVGANPADLHARPVFDLRQTLREAPLRGPVALRRGLHPQGLMRPLLVVLAPEALQGLLLGPPRRFGRLRHGFLQRLMDPLMAAVFFGVTRTDPFRPDPEPHPPDRQSRQASQGRHWRREAHCRCGSPRAGRTP